MKLSTILYALVAASATITMATPIDDSTDSQSTPSTQSEQKTQTTKTVNTDCNPKSKELNECLQTLDSIKNFKNKCDAYKSEKCKVFADFAKAKQESFNDIYSSFSCGGGLSKRQDNSTAVSSISLNKSDTTTVVSLAKIWSKAYDVACVDMSKDKVCPIGYAFIDEDNYDNAINNSCQSKDCTDAAYAFLEENLGQALNNNLGIYVEDQNIKLSPSGVIIEDKDFNGLAEYQDTRFNKPFTRSDASRKDQYNFYAMAFLKSDYCTRQQKSTSEGGSSGNSSSDATTIKYSLMLTIVTLLFALF